MAWYSSTDETNDGPSRKLASCNRLLTAARWRQAHRENAVGNREKVGVIVISECRHGNSSSSIEFIQQLLNCLTGQVNSTIL